MPTVRSGDADIAYEVTGSGDPVLMIMGFAVDRRMWMLQIPACSPSYSVITFDNRGVGESSQPPGPYSMEMMAADALAVLDAAGAERAHVVGISMGGAIAQHVALKAPERVRSLVLAATWGERNPYLERLTALGHLLAENLVDDEFLRAFTLLLFSPKFVIENAQMLEMIEAMGRQISPPVEAFRHQLHAVEEHDVLEQLAGLSIPTTVMGARRDFMVPYERQQRLAAAIPAAELRTFETGHAFNFEEMEAFNAALLEFLGRH